MYFGILALLIAFGVLAGVLVNFGDEKGDALLVTSVDYLSRQSIQVCKSPRNTLLSIDVSVPAGAYYYTREDKLCGRLDDKIKCVIVGCLFEESTFLNLSAAQDVFDSRVFTCSIHNDELLRVSCQG